MLKRPIASLKGVGKVKSEYLKKLNLELIGDLIHNYPVDYIDKGIIKNSTNVENDEMCTLKATIISKRLSGFSRNGKQHLQVTIFDGFYQGEVLFFEPKYYKNKFNEGETYYFYGKIEKKGFKFKMVHPENFSLEEVQKRNVLRITPKYPLTKGITSRDMVKIHDAGLVFGIDFVKENLPNMILSDLKIIGIEKAIRNIHFPQNEDALILSRKRLITQELLELQLKLILMKKSSQKRSGELLVETAYIGEFIESLPYDLTDAQIKVFDEIKRDLTSGYAMNRLVQGDVGSGKTILAILAMLMAVENGHQGAFMAPTELLAEQQYKHIIDLLDCRYNIEILTSSVKKKKKDEIIESLKNGEIDIIVGTHSLIQDYIEFKSLGVIITDEQHRFGVRQRSMLEGKSEKAHILTMSATPIPRTLSLILYGDMNISIIDELPKGRKVIKTHYINSKKINDMFDFIKKEVGKGRQIYFVCPLVEENEESNLKSVEKVFDKLSNSIFPDLHVAMVHGKMKSDTKDQVMKEFSSGKVDILVATTVIEVGINVPNASIMVVLNTERFGLAQLHQLRGRVGRGGEQSYCFLLSDKLSKNGKERIETMVSTNDGFVIADKDLELRGSGDMFGTKQHGIVELKIADLIRDKEILFELQDYISLLMKEYNSNNIEIVNYFEDLKKEMYKNFTM